MEFRSAWSSESSRTQREDSPKFQVIAHRQYINHQQRDWAIGSANAKCLISIGLSLMKLLCLTEEGPIKH